MRRSKGIASLSLYFIAMNLITLDYIAGFRLADRIPALLILSCLFMNNALMLLGGFFGALIALALIILGIFLFSMREKARKIFIFVQGLSILGGLCIAPVEIARWSGGGSVLEHAPMIFFYAIVFNIVPVIFLIFFTRKKVKEQFT